MSFVVTPPQVTAQKRARTKQDTPSIAGPPDSEDDTDADDTDDDDDYGTPGESDNRTSNSELREYVSDTSLLACIFLHLKQ